MSRWWSKRGETAFRSLDWREVKSSQVKSIQIKQQTTIRKPIECAPEASRGGRESMEMTEGDPSRGDTS